MRGAASLILLMLAACEKPAAEPDNAPVTANTPVEIEALPADESAATPTEELANGAVEPEPGEPGNQN